MSQTDQVTVERWVPVASVAKVKMRGLSSIPAGAPLKISHVRNQWGENLVVFCSKPISTGDLISSEDFWSRNTVQFKKLPNCCREIRMFQLALRTYFGIYISKWQGSVKHFQQKFKLARFFWSEGPKFRMKGLFPSCQVLGFGPTTKYLTWISARHCCQKSSHLCGPLAHPQGFFHSTSRGEIIPVNLEPIYFRPCFTRPDSYNDQLGARATPHLPSCVQFRHAGPTSDKRRTGGVIGVGSPVIIAANEVEKKWTEIWRWSPKNHLDVLSGVRN